MKDIETNGYDFSDEPLLDKPVNRSSKSPSAFKRGFARCIRSTQPNFKPKKAAILLMAYAFVMGATGAWIYLQNYLVNDTTVEYTDL